jgi:uncharacterized membrane protein YcaP (DUF421 family)
MFFDGWESVARVAATAAVIYLALLAVLRVVGEQALAKMSAYDLIVTVALGSLVASIPLSSGITVTDGLAAIGTYLALQEVTRIILKHSRRARSVVKAAPRIVLWDGRLLHDRLSAANLTEDEVRAAVRRAGRASYSEVLAVILENDGEWSVVSRSDATDLSAFEGLDVPAVATQYSLPFGGSQPAGGTSREETSTAPSSGHV